jgi:hypothetical protein
MRLPVGRQHLGWKKMRLPVGRQLVYQAKDNVCSTEEARMGLSKKRILAAVYPSDNAAELVIQATAIADRMDGNAYFPAPVPSLAEVRTAIVALQQAAVAAESKTRGTVSARNKVYADLSTLLMELKTSVEHVANKDPERAVVIIESAGMTVWSKALPAKPPLAASNGSLSGTVLLVARAVAKVATYGWQMSEDGGTTWIDLPKTNQAKTAVSNLVPGRTYWFRFRALTRKGTTDGCDPVSIIVQ